MTWHIKIVHKQVQSKTYKAQKALTDASTTNREHKLKQYQKRFIQEVKSTCSEMWKATSDIMAFTQLYF